jgi:hypothetical protein
LADDMPMGAKSESRDDDVTAYNFPLGRVRLPDVLSAVQLRLRGEMKFYLTHIPRRWKIISTPLQCWSPFYNSCRVHSAHGKSPAQASGLTDYTWTIGELLKSEANY